MTARRPPFICKRLVYRRKKGGKMLCLVGDLQGRGTHILRGRSQRKGDTCRKSTLQWGAKGGIQKRGREVPSTGGGRDGREGDKDSYGFRSYRQEGREPLFLLVVLGCSFWGRSTWQLPRGSLRCGKANDKSHGIWLRHTNRLKPGKRLV